MEKSSPRLRPAAQSPAATPGTDPDGDEPGPLEPALKRRKATSKQATEAVAKGGRLSSSADELTGMDTKQRTLCCIIDGQCKNVRVSG
jgi:hypothetical protein